ncbi:hypothetical protein ES703_52095 [subsurface metagenome]
MVVEPAVKEKIFRLKPEQDERLPRLIKYAYQAGYIKNKSRVYASSHSIAPITASKTSMSRGREGVSPAKSPCFTVNCDG